MSPRGYGEGSALVGVTAKVDEAFSSGSRGWTCSFLASFSKKVQNSLSEDENTAKVSVLQTKLQGVWWFFVYFCGLVLFSLPPGFQHVWFWGLFHQLLNGGEILFCQTACPELEHFGIAEWWWLVTGLAAALLWLFSLTVDSVQIEDERTGL